MGGLMKALHAVLQECLEKSTRVETVDENGEPLDKPGVTLNAETFLAALDDCDLTVRHK
jgi:hypothetical protein